MDSTETKRIKSPRLLYIENLRILLSALVVIVHVACTYGGPGGWAYVERGAKLATRLPLTILNATSQSFFMGMFFFIAAYFTQKSFQKKGFIRFTKDRIIRLGVPLAIYYFFISTLTAYISWSVKHPDQPDMSYLELFQSGWVFSFGVMWFVLAISYFTMIYLIVSLVFPGIQKSNNQPLPGIKTYQIIVSAIVIGVLTFIVRIKFPLFTSSGISWLPFDLGHFPQYIFLYILGIISARYTNDVFISFKKAKNWLWFVLFLIVVVFPLIFFIGKAYPNGLKAFAGRGTWHSLSYAVWEQLVGISIIVGLIGVSKVKWNMQSPFMRRLSDSAFAVYALHPPVLVGISMIFVNWKVMLLIKFLALTPIALIASFGIALIVKKIPVLKRIF